MSKTVMPLLLLSLMLVQGLKAQQDTLGALRTSDSLVWSKGVHELHFRTGLEVNSNALNNRFIGQFYRGNYLGDELRVSTSERLRDHNLGGYRLDASLYYYFIPEVSEKRFGYFVGIEEHEMAELSFRKGFFDLMFFGNDPYTGTFVSFDGMGLNLMAWQQIKAGVVKDFFRKGDRHRLKWAFGFNIGQKRLNADIESGSFFTQQDGDYVALDLDMQYFRTDSNRMGFGAFNGYGPSFDISYEFYDEQHHQFGFSLQNFGYIRWDRGPVKFSRDTTVKFEGFEIDLINLNSPLIGENFGDSLLEAVTGQGRVEAVSTWMPLDIDLYYIYTFKNPSFMISLEARHRIHTLYRPYAQLGFAYRYFFKKAVAGLQPQVSYGGYGSWNAGFRLFAKFCQKSELSCGLSTIDAMICPEKKTGLSGHLTFSQKF
jgi:hypothetical protein